MIDRRVKLMAGVILLIWITGSILTVVSEQTEEVMEEWVRESIYRISQKIDNASGEYDSPFAPRILLGPIVTRTSPSGKFYESQFGLHLRDSIYMRIAAGLVPIKVKVVDADVLAKALENSRLGSAARLNAINIASVYNEDRDIKQCIKLLMDSSDMVVLGQVTLDGTQAQTTFSILRMVNNQLYLDQTPVSVRVPPISDLSIDIEKTRLDRMIAFTVSNDNSVQDSVKKFIHQFTDAWREGDVGKIMSYYDKDVSAVTLTINEDSQVELTYVLDGSGLERFWTKLVERHSTTDFDLSDPEVYSLKRNSKNIVSCIVDFQDSRTRTVSLISFYMQLRQDGRRDWKVYFQRIKATPKYFIQLQADW